MFGKIMLIFVVIVLFKIVYGELPNSLKEELESYKRNINASLELEKHDRSLMNIWLEEQLIKQLNITCSYKLQMIRHKEHNFGTKLNLKWKNCLELYKIEIKKSESLFNDGELKCVKVAQIADKEKKLAVSQIDKEIRKWRKSYRYLVNLCRTENPDDEDEAGVCLVEYMLRDNYNLALQRLIILKMESMATLYSAIVTSISQLDSCLRKTFSKYLEKVRSIMDILDRCYNGIPK